MNTPRLTRAFLLDAALAVALAIVAVYEVIVRPLAEDVIEGPLWLNVLAALLGTLPLAFRRREPLWVTLVLAATLAGRALVADPLEIYPTFLALIVAVYTVASYAPLREALVGAAFTALAVEVAIVRGSGTDSAPDPLASLVLIGAIWLLGRVVGVRNERARALLAARDQHAAESVTAERERIARELHDAVSHSLAAIVTQASGARNVMASDPDRASRSLAAIEQSAREGLDEMRRLLGLLGNPEHGFDPPPGLSSVPGLVERVREAGVDVDLRLDESALHLPAATDASAYRVVQEALTNTIKHAPGSEVAVDARVVDGAVHLEVSDSGARQPVEPGPDGYGLTGLRERVRLLGGDFEAGPMGDGFRVRARLPL